MSNVYKAPHIERAERHQAAMSMLKGAELPSGDDAPATTGALPAPPVVQAPHLSGGPAPAPPAPPAAATPAPPAPAPNPPAEYVPVSEFQRLAAEHRELRRQVLDRHPPAPQVDAVALEAKKAIENRDYDALKRMGLDLNEWADHTLKDTTDPTGAAVRNLNQTVQQLQAQLAQTQQELKQRHEAEQQAVERRAINETVAEIQSTLQSDPELRLLSLAGREGEVYNVMAQHAARTLQETGVAEYMPPAQAARLVLQQEAQRLQGLFEHARTLPTYAPYFSPAPSAQPVTSKPPVLGTQISAAQTSGTEPPREVSRDERRHQLAQWLRAQQGQG